MSARILIVDDDAQVLEVLRRFLVAEGYDVLEAASAEQAVGMVEALPPAVAFCDVHMTGANGLWLADQIRAIAPATALVLATGDTQVPPMESLRPGVVGYLLKPLKSKQVLAAAAQGVRWSADAVARGAHRQPRKRLGPAD